MKFCQSIIAMCMLTVMGATTVQAGIVVGGTRLVYDGSKKESTLTIRNPDSRAYLIQSWVDSGEGSSEKAPFLVTPPLYRQDGGQNNILRVVRTGGSFPEDRESVYWMNVKSIPSADKDALNTLQIAVKTRIKLFYRPSNVAKLRPADFAKNLTWRRTGNTLEVNNPTPFHFTFLDIKVGGVKLESVSGMVSPHGSLSFPLPGSVSGTQVDWGYINDYGGRTAQSSSL